MFAHQHTARPVHACSYSIDGEVALSKALRHQLRHLLDGSFAATVEKIILGDRGEVART